MADAPEIKVKLTAEDTGVSSAIKELTSQLKGLKKQQDETAASGISLKNAFAGIVAVAGTLELGRIGKDAFDSAVNIGKMADKTGITTQTLSVFHHVAEETGVSTEAVDKALTKAAKSITEFEQGSSKAAKGFQLLGITQKDFAGLKSDEKIALVTERLGHMSAGFQKAAATQLIFSRGGAEFIPVANAIAGEGFDKVTESARRLGLLLDQKTTDSFRQAKAAMTELAAVGKGMATQFEAGLVPAITDVGKALTDSLTQGGLSFQDLGRYAGNAVKGIALIFLGLGQTIGTIAASIADVFEALFKEIANAEESYFQAVDQVAHGHVNAAFGTLKQGVKNSTAIVSDEVDRQKAIYKSLGDSFKADYKNLFQSTEKPPLRPDDQTEAPAIQDDSAAKAHLSLLKQQLDQDLALYREFEKVRLAVDQRQFDEGQLSLKDYFAVRRAEILAENQKEIQILEAQRALEKQEPTETETAGIQKKAKIQALDAKIAEAREAQVLKLATLETEEFNRGEENRKKILEFHKLIDTTQGKALEAAKAEIAIEQQKLQIILAQSGASKAEIDQELARYAAVKTAQVEFTEQQKDGAAALKVLADQRAEIEDRVKTGQLFQVQGEEQIRALEQARLPVLQQIADQLLAQAKATGDEQKIAQAEDFQKQVSQIAVQSNQVGQQIATIKQGLSGAITGGFTQFFGSLVQGTQSVGQAFRGLASSVISSLAQIAAQMIAQLILTKLLKSALGGFSGGGLVGGGGGGGGGFAEGGLIRGPGGPKSDSIPARVSPGEYIVKADAVAKFGVANLEAINRGLKTPSFERLALPRFAEGGLVGNVRGSGGDSSIHLGIDLAEGLILKHLGSKAAQNVILQTLTNNPKAAGKALSRSD